MNNTEQDTRHRLDELNRSWGELEAVVAAFAALSVVVAIAVLPSGKKTSEVNEKNVRTPQSLQSACEEGIIVDYKDGKADLVALPMRGRDGKPVCNIKLQP